MRSKQFDPINILLHFKNYSQINKNDTQLAPKYILKIKHKKDWFEKWQTNLNCIKTLFHNK